MTAPATTAATRKPPGRTKRRLLTLTLTLVAAGALAGAAAPAAFAGVDGGVDMNAFCVANYGPDTSAVADGDNVYSWVCAGGGTEPLIKGGINVNEQCQVQYGPAAVAQFSDYNDPYSWYCYTS